MGETSKLRSFDNKIKNYEDRKKYVENVLEQVNVEDIIKNSLNNDNHIYNNTEKYLEDLGTYLLDSQDIPSGRKVEETFYHKESHLYRNAISKNTMELDKTYIENLGALHNRESNKINEEYISRLFSNIDASSVRNIIRKMDSELNEIENSYLRDYIDFIFNDTINKCNDGKDLLVINLYSKGLTEMMISEKIKISQPAINKRLKKITKKV
ncbi:hypothetical protein [Enterococcus sp. N249-2]